MSDVVVTTKTDFPAVPGVATVSTVKSLSSMRLGTVVYHSSYDSEVEVAEILSRLEFNNILYISSPDSVRPEVLMIVQSRGGYHITDEVYFTNGKFLQELISNPGLASAVVSGLTNNASVNKVLDGLQSKVSKGDFSFSDGDLKIISSAVDVIRSGYNRDSALSLQSANAITSIFESLSGNNALVQKELNTAKSRIDELRDKVEELNNSALVSTSNSSGSNVLNFPVTQYAQSSDCIVIKELGSVPHLTSFVYGLRNYLVSKGHRVLIMFMVPYGGVWESMYSNFPGVSFVNKDTIKDKRNYGNDVFFTNYPNSLMVKNFLDKASRQNYTYTIVVDRTNLSEQPLLKPTHSKTAYVRTFYAVQSPRLAEDLVKRKVCPARRILTSGVSFEGSSLYIPFFEDYSPHIENRERKYARYCGQMYSEMVE